MKEFYFKLTFDSVSFGEREISNYKLGCMADSSEAAQESVIEFIESMGGRHGEILKIEKLDAAPLPGISIESVS